jgi:hypothetical protein
MRRTLLSFTFRLIVAWAMCTVLLSMARAAPPNTISGSEAICDPFNPQNCAQPNAAGELLVAPYPNATPVTASSGNVAAATATATLPAVAAKTNYVSGFEITSSGGTAGCFNPTLTGITGGTMTFTYCITATQSVAPLVVPFYPPIPASAVNTAIAISLPAMAASTNATVSIQGYVK